MRLKWMAVLLLSASTVYANEWHIRTDGSDTHCRGTEDAAFNPSRHRGGGNKCAFQHLQQAFTVVRRKDVITWHAGTYTLAPADATATCYTGLKCFANMPSKSGVGPIVLRGERDHDLDANDPNGLLTIADGNNVINAAILSSIDQLEIRDIRFQNFIGDPNQTTCMQMAIVGLYGNDVRYIGNAHFNPLSDAHQGEAGDLALDGQRYLVRGLWMESGHPVLISVGQIRSPDGDVQLDTQNGTIEAVNMARVRHLHVNGTLADPIWGILYRGVSRPIQRNSYYVDLATDNQSTGEHRGIELRDSTRADVYGNVVADLKGDASYFVTSDTRGLIDEQHFIHNNVGHRIDSTVTATAFRFACNGCRVRNNLAVSDVPTSSGWSCYTSDSDSAGVISTIDYTAMFEVNRTMARVINTAWKCPSITCAADVNDMISPTPLLATHDINTTGAPGWLGTGGKPYPFYRAAVDSLISTGAEVASCPASCGGICWFGAYGAQAGCVPSSLAPFPR